MKLYYLKESDALAVHIIINEMNLSCEFESLNAKAKQIEKDNVFNDIPPKEPSPTLVTDDNITIKGSVVILQYLVDKHNVTSLLPPVGNLNRYKVLEWLNFLFVDVHKYLTLHNCFASDRFEAFIKDIFIPKIKVQIEKVNNAIQKNKYLTGDQFTLPDAYLFWILINDAKHGNFIINEFPTISRYFEDLKKRQSIVKALHEEGYE